MKRLILIRHAKSDWSTAAAADHDRPLNARGRQAATALGDWLRDTGLIPDQVLSSSSERTGETYLRLALPETIPTRFTRDLYLAGPERILEVLKQAEGDVVMMLGHNPGIGLFAQEALASPPDHSQFDSYPTGATLVADFETEDWREARWGGAVARHFVVPREIV